jgi:hypothetical protein
MQHAVTRLPEMSRMSHELEHLMSFRKIEQVLG